MKGTQKDSLETPQPQRKKRESGETVYFGGEERFHWPDRKIYLSFSKNWALPDAEKKL